MLPKHHPLAPSWPIGVLLLALLLGGACRSTRPEKDWGVRSELKGIASWYGPGFHGKPTASGEIFDTHALTAAHRTLPFDSIVEVSNLDNGKRVRVRINDRGPFIRGRVIDLSKAGAKAIDMIGPGTARVSLRVVKRPSTPPAQRARSAKVQFLVQVGAFRNADRAHRLADRLRPTYPTIKVTTSTGWHRVQIGPFKDHSRAKKIVSALGRDGIAAVVKRSAY